MKGNIKPSSHLNRMDLIIIRLYVFGGKHQVATFLKNTYNSLGSINNEHLFAPISTSGFTTTNVLRVFSHYITPHKTKGRFIKNVVNILVKQR